MARTTLANVTQCHIERISPCVPYGHHGAAAQARYQEATAVQVVGYDNNKGAWLYKQSWGREFAMGGYAWVGYNVSGVCRPTDTWGLFFYHPKGVWPPIPLQPAPSRPGCFTYKAQPGDYPSKLAEQLGLDAKGLRQLLLDNVDSIRDPSQLPPGASILLCGIKPSMPPASASSPGRQAPAAVPATTAAAGRNRSSTRGG
jgi:hypothetical protein